MKKINKTLIVFFLSVFFMGCFASNTDLRPKKVLVREFKGLQVEVSRSDLSGVFVDVQNRTNQEISILWAKSTLGDSEIVRHDGVINTGLNYEETKLKSTERQTFVLHRKVDFYYLDPVLYAKGGLRIKPLKYPVELKLNVKMNGKQELISIFIDNNYQSIENAKSDRYLEDKYNQDKKQEADILDKNYFEDKIDKRKKENIIKKIEKPYKDNLPVEDSLIIEHRK